MFLFPVPHSWVLDHVSSRKDLGPEVYLHTKGRITKASKGIISRDTQLTYVSLFNFSLTDTIGWSWGYFSKKLASTSHTQGSPQMPLNLWTPFVLRSYFTFRHSKRRVTLDNRPCCRQRNSQITFQPDVSNAKPWFRVERVLAILPGKMLLGRVNHTSDQQVHNHWL